MVNNNKSNQASRYGIITLILQVILLVAINLYPTTTMWMNIGLITATAFGLVINIRNTYVLYKIKKHNKRYIGFK